jgi:hypothetical protein
MIRICNYFSTQQIHVNIPPQFTENWSRYSAESVWVRIPVRPSLSIRWGKSFTSLIMIRMHVDIFSGVSGPQQKNEFRTWQEKTHCPSSRNSRGISVRKSILKIHSRKTFCVEKFWFDFRFNFWFNLLKEVTWDLRLILGAILLAEKLRIILTK